MNEDTKKSRGGKRKMMWTAIFLVGVAIGITLGVSMDYWDTREYRRNFKRNLRGLRG